MVGWSRSLMVAMAGLLVGQPACGRFGDGARKRADLRMRWTGAQNRNDRAIATAIVFPQLRARRRPAAGRRCSGGELRRGRRVCASHVTERVHNHGPGLFQRVVRRDELGIGRAVPIQNLDGLAEAGKKGVMIVFVHASNGPAIARLV
jgi:hypothetical protein